MSDTEKIVKDRGWRIIVRFIFLAVLLFLTVSCVQNEASPNLDQLQRKNTQKEIMGSFSIEAAPSDKVGVLCDAFIDAGEFAEASRCIARSSSHESYANYSAVINYYSSLQQFDKAREFAGLYVSRSSLEQEMEYDPVKKSELYMLIKYIGTVGALSARINDIEKAHECLRQLRIIRLANRYHGNILRYVDVYEARVWFALGNYRAVVKVLNDRSDHNGIMEVTAMAIGAPLFLSLGAVAGELDLAMGILEDSFISNRKDQVLNLFLYSISLVHLGAYDKAIDSLSSVIDSDLIGDNLRWKALHQRGVCLLKANRKTQGVQDLLEAATLTEKSRATIIDETGKIGYANNISDLFSDIIAYYIDNNDPPMAFDFVERAKSRSFLDSLLDRRINNNKPGLDDASGSSATETLHNEVGLYTKGEDSNGVPDRLEAFLTAKPITLGELQARLHGNETVLEYYFGHSMYVFVITTDAIEVIDLGEPLSGQEIHAFVESIKTEAGLRRGIEVAVKSELDESGQILQSQAYTLFDRLIGPVENRIREDRLTIIPHGPLHYLPFSVLRSEGKWFTELYIHQIVPSASTLKYIGSGTIQNSGQSIVLGNPDRNDKEYDLPSAHEEAEIINDIIHTDSKLFLREHATETVIKNLQGSFDFIHIASHAKYDADNPLQSMLLLAADNENDGDLTVGELYECSFQANLITLSACQTGLGEVSQGDDVIGFSRALLYAGGRNILTSLWQIDDSFTKEFMVEFYQNMEDYGYRDALSKTKRDFIRQGGDPYLWGAFELIGAPQ